jgi:hypothetical protein
LRRRLPDASIALIDSLVRPLPNAGLKVGQAMPMAAKLLWDFAAAWGYVAPQMFNLTFLDRVKSAPIRDETSTFFFLQNSMQKFFEEWGGAQSTGACSFEFFDYLALPFLSEFRLRNLATGKSLAELVEDARLNMELFEELAQVLFLVAAADVLPEEAHRFARPTWFNAWSIGLDPNQWEEDGLFRPQSPARELREVEEAVFAQFGLT